MKTLDCICGITYSLHHTSFPPGTDCRKAIKIYQQNLANIFDAGDQTFFHQNTQSVVLQQRFVIGSVTVT